MPRGSELKVKTEVEGRSVSVTFSDMTPGQLLAITNSLKLRPESPVAKQVLKKLENSFRRHAEAMKNWGV